VRPPLGWRFSALFQTYHIGLFGCSLSVRVSLPFEALSLCPRMLRVVGYVEFFTEYHTTPPTLSVFFLPVFHFLLDFEKQAHFLFFSRT